MWCCCSISDTAPLPHCNTTETDVSDQVSPLVNNKNSGQNFGTDVTLISEAWTSSLNIMQPMHTKYFLIY